MNEPFTNFAELHKHSFRLLRKGWQPIVLFGGVSIPAWIGMGMIQSPDFHLLLTDPTQFAWLWFYHSILLSVIGVAIACVTLGPATFWLLRIAREKRQSISARDALLGVFLPGLLDLSIGLVSMVMVFAIGVGSLAGFLQYAPDLSLTSRIFGLMMLMMLFVSLFGFLLGAIYPRIRWLTIASLSGDHPIRERVRYSVKLPRPTMKVLWGVVTLEQVTALLLTLAGGIIAAKMFDIPSFQMDPRVDPFQQFNQIADFMSRGSSPAIAALNGLGWIAVWLFLPYWVVAYESLPKPDSAALTKVGSTASTTAQI